MAINITLYSSSKRVNSTAIPSGGTDYGVTLKNGCSVLAPVFLLNLSSCPYNMASWDGRYYFITDITWLRDDLCEISCTVDPLASWRADIMATSAYVLYSSSSYNTMLTDSRLMTEVDGTLSTWIGDKMNIFDEDGSYVVGVIGKPNAPSVSGMCTVYSLTARECSDLAVSFSEGEVMEQVKQQFGDVFNCLIFSRWIPVAVDGGPSSVISLANYNTGVTGHQMQHRYQSGGFQVVLNWPTDDFRSVEPYSVGYLFLPYVGVVTVELSNIRELDYLYIEVVIDKYTGDIVYNLGGMSHPLAVYSGNCAVEIPINSYQRDWKGVVQNGVSTVVSTIQNLVGGGMAIASAGAMGATSMLGGIGGELSNFANTAMSYFTFNTGSKGGFSGGCGAGLQLKPEFTIVHHTTSQNPVSMSNIDGRPCGRTLRMSNLSGYVQTSAFKVGGLSTAMEKQKIESLMKGGVYLE